jgi:hypothetical protein
MVIILGVAEYLLKWVPGAPGFREQRNKEQLPRKLYAYSVIAHRYYVTLVRTFLG